MNDNNINIEQIVNHWIESSDEDTKAMQALFEAKSYYWALFIGHISMEKLLKAYYVKKFKTNAPFTHNLYRLAELCEIELTDDYADWLDYITSFNIEARYDDYKKEFYSLCNFEFTLKWINNIKELIKWLKTMF